MRWKIEFKTLVKNEKQDCEFMILNMQDENLNERECWKNVELIWKFLREIDSCKKIFYDTKLIVPNTKEFIGNLEKFERIG